MLDPNAASAKNLNDKRPGQDTVTVTKSTAKVISDTDRNSKEIGKYLLQGWRMLDEYCPVTGDVPLMQAPPLHPPPFFDLY